MNNELGPAFIKSFVIKVDEKGIPGKGAEPIEKTLQVLLSKERYQAEFGYPE